MVDLPAVTPIHLVVIPRTAILLVAIILTQDIKAMAITSANNVIIPDNQHLDTGGMDSLMAVIAIIITIKTTIIIAALNPDLTHRLITIIMTTAITRTNIGTIVTVTEEMVSSGIEITATLIEELGKAVTISPSQDDNNLWS